MASLSNINQAEHNESVCDYLIKDGKFSDWVVTTAFYSSLQYIRHCLLPYDDGVGGEYHNFERLFRNKKQDSEGRHGFQLRMVKKHCSQIGYEYQRLWEMSTNARYSNYKYEKHEATIARTYLDQIRVYVTKQTKV